MKSKKFDLTAVNEAKAMGSVEFAQGVKCIPACSTYIDELVSKRFSSWSDFDTNTRREAMKAWIAGWTQANLAIAA